ncbi:peptidase S8/S53 domain-containing protein [Scenedesmus sp. NREL 46B-D3]|nr:peptidase S8/S53 domain-containing protein [Scenedesmus sp. NREL 46B-D3]
MSRLQRKHLAAPATRAERRGSLLRRVIKHIRQTGLRLRAPLAPAPAPVANTTPAPSTGNVPRLTAQDTDIQERPALQQLTRMLRRQGLAAGEQVPPGISFIEAATADAVPYTEGAMQGDEQQVTVALVDSGVDANHPDLVYAGGKSWLRRPSRRMPGDSTDPGVDFFGHGTHVAGIIGARNSGRGIVGVAPGQPVFSLKVLDGSGQGALSDALAAVRWAAGREGRAYNIKVINLSIAAYVSPDSDDAEDTLRIVCQIFQEASDAGVLVITAAGNYQDSLLNYVPAACPAVAAVTAVDPSSRAASPFSNYLPAHAPAADKARVMAAPGSGVMSTMSIQREPSRYSSLSAAEPHLWWQELRLSQDCVELSQDAACLPACLPAGFWELSGTSQASPHVAGIAATCIQSGACRPSSTGMQKLAVLQAAARQRMAQRRPYGFRGDPASAKGAASFLAWAKFWDG